MHLHLYRGAYFMLITRAAIVVIVVLFSTSASGCTRRDSASPPGSSRSSDPREMAKAVAGWAQDGEYLPDPAAPSSSAPDGQAGRSDRDGAGPEGTMPEGERCRQDAESAKRPGLRRDPSVPPHSSPITTKAPPEAGPSRRTELNRSRERYSSPCSSTTFGAAFLRTARRFGFAGSGSPATAAPSTGAAPGIESAANSAAASSGE